MTIKGFTDDGRCFGIPIKTKKEGEMILKAIHSPKFKKLLSGAKWSFQTPHQMFEYFKKDFTNISKSRFNKHLYK